MLDSVKIEDRLKENMSDNEELEMLLGEIPHAIHHPYNHHQHELSNEMKNVMEVMSGKDNGLCMYGDDEKMMNHTKFTCALPLPVTDLSWSSDGCTSNLFYAGHSVFENGSPTSPLEDSISANSNNHNDLHAFDAPINKLVTESMIDEVDISRNLSQMYISDAKEFVPIGLNHVPFHHEQSSKEFENVVVDKDSSFCHDVDLRSHYSYTKFEQYDAPSSYVHGMNSHHRQLYHMGFPLSEMPIPLATDGLKSYERMNTFISPVVPHLIPHHAPQFKPANILNFHHPLVTGRNQFHRAKLPQWQLNSTVCKGKEQVREHNSVSTFQGISRQRHQDKRSFLESRRNEKMQFSFSFPAKCSSIEEAQGQIYYIAKDQHGCRFLQRMFDEGNPRDFQIIFNEIIGHVVELMINPFGNYLMQKLLEVCNEEHRMQIILKVTQQPGELVRISLNTHGTRVVQKLIETLKTRHQVSLVIDALEPGFITLIKDLNGNHVVQRCLQCLSNEHNKFIFVAAAKYCVEIATHQHGCCVLQRCISHSSGEHHENLLAQISANGLLLAQDSFGNYVVQFILELNIPSSISKLVSQFEGNYVFMSKQKFSSHVVEKCLSVCGEQIQLKILQELLYETHFEHLLQDPHANYVIQTAIRVVEGPLLDVLLDAIKSHRTISRNSPYSKRILSHKLLKK